MRLPCRFNIWLAFWKTRWVESKRGWWGYRSLEWAQPLDGNVQSFVHLQYFYDIWFCSRV